MAMYTIYGYGPGSQVPGMRVSGVTPMKQLQGQLAHVKRSDSRASPNLPESVFNVLEQSLRASLFEQHADGHEDRVEQQLKDRRVCAHHEHIQARLFLEHKLLDAVNAKMLAQVGIENRFEALFVEIGF